MTNASLDIWLGNEKRETELPDFTIFDVSEHSPITNITMRLLSTLVNEFLFEPQVLKDLRAVLGNKMRQALDAATPSTSSLRAGVFGEALSAELCERWHAYVVPLKRLRITGGSPPGTDLIALRVGADDRLTEVCYIECKLRTTTDHGVAVDAYEQLGQVRQGHLPLVSLHLANYLLATGSPLYSSFMNYLTSRASQPAVDSYRIALTWEDSLWSETALTNLQDKSVELTPLSVDVIRIAKLRSLIETVYDSLGLEALNDDD